MRNLAIVIALALSAGPALAGFGAVDLPRLDWPTGGTVTTSTMGCPAPVTTPVKTPACQ